MTTDLQLTVKAQIAERSIDLRDLLTKSSHAAATSILARPDVLRSVVAADSLPPGLIVLAGSQAAEVADLVAQVIDGERLLAAEERALCEIPEAMIRAVKSAFHDRRAQLAAAKSVGNSARLTYQALVRRVAAEREADLRRQAAEAQRKAAEQAKEAGDDDEPPPGEVAPVAVPRTVAGGVGKAGTATRIVIDKVADAGLVPHGWLELNDGLARADFLEAERAGQLKRAAPNEVVTWRGVVFRTVEHAVNRRT